MFAAETLPFERPECREYPLGAGPFGKCADWARTRSAKATPAIGSITTETPGRYRRELDDNAPYFCHRSGQRRPLATAFATLGHHHTRDDRGHCARNIAHQTLATVVEWSNHGFRHEQDLRSHSGATLAPTGASPLAYGQQSGGSASGSTFNRCGGYVVFHLLSA